MESACRVARRSLRPPAGVRATGARPAAATTRTTPGNGAETGSVAASRDGDAEARPATDGSTATEIRTPDRRLRVFVSSTLGELADERAAVARAIASLRLTPVLFEQAARPYPPRDLYRAYLSQSDVFVGLYWQRYGWIGPGSEISGLEDELERSRALPRLLYVKAPAPDRDARLTAMLDRIRNEGATSYRTFHTPRELGRLVRDDLAVLLSERFTATRPLAGPAPRRSPTGRGRRSLPVGTTPLFGLRSAIGEVAGLVTRREVRLVTLTGPGGIGKTRLALAVGERLRARSGSGTAFVPLAGVTRPDLVVTGIARTIGVDLTGTASPLDVLVEHLGDDRWLLILDNLEQVVAAAGDLDELLARCPGVTILATSRTALRLRAEREYPVPPLPPPADPATVTLEELSTSPAVALFVGRARAVRPGFALAEDNAPAVVEICRRLEGLPLAIELAAARIRLLDPHTLLGRLTRSLDAVGTGPVDMPERQRTLRATVEWSLGLLDDAERFLIETMAVFVNGWTLEAAAHVAGLDEDRALELTEALARHSLVQVDSTELGPRSRMLETVRQFVAERLAARPDLAEVERRHADHYRALAERADRPLRGIGQGAWADRLEAEAANLAAAVGWYLAHDAAPLPHLFRVLWPFWSLRDHLGEARSWIDQLLSGADALDPQAQAELVWTATLTAIELGDDAAALAARHRLAPLLDEIEDPDLRALCRLALAWSAPITGDIHGALRDASTSAEQLRSQGQPFWTALALNTLGALEIAVGRYNEAHGHLSEVRDLGEGLDNRWVRAGSRAQLGTLAILRGQLDDARTLLEEGLVLSLEAQSTRYVSLCLAAMARLALAEGDPERAALVAGAAEGLSRRAGIRAWPTQLRDEAALRSELRRTLGADGLDRAFTTGSQLSQREAVAAARPGTPPAPPRPE
jgi:predicted ATPase